MFIKDALKNGKELLKNSSTTNIDTELILCHVLSCKRSDLIKNPDQELTKEEEDKFKELIEERSKGKPIAYIIHEKEFYGRPFYVDERVLIPRPETEEMVEESIKYLKNHPEIKTIIDLGTGSGCIAITLALEFQERSIIGLDISKDALDVANRNKRRHNCKNIILLKSNLLSIVINPKNHKQPKNLKDLNYFKDPKNPICIIANLPYIGTKTNHFVSEETKIYEPNEALYGGKDGLDLYRKTWKEIKENKINLACLFMEIGSENQGMTIKKECSELFPKHTFQIKKDLAGIPRIAQLKSTT